MGEEAARKIENQLFRELSYEITDPELERIKRELKLDTYGGFGAGQIQREFKSADDVFDKLKRKGVTKLGNYIKLRKLFADLGFQHLCEIIQKKENELRAMHWPVESDSADSDSGLRGGPYSQPTPPMQGPGGYPGAPMYGNVGHPLPQTAHFQPPGFPPQHQQPHPLQASFYPREQQYMTSHVPQGAPYQPESLRFNTSIGGYGEQPTFPQTQGRMASSKMPPPSYQQERRQSPPVLRSLDDATPESSDVFMSNPPLPKNIPYNHRIFYEPGRGYVLFINNLFVGRSDHRRGADKDEENIRELFHSYLTDFYLQYQKDVTKAELMKYLDAMQATLSSGTYKSFIMIIGSHGQPKKDVEKKIRKDCVLMADDQWMQVEDIVSCFHGDNIPAMKDKPKIFIIQSCRGKGLQKSVSLSDAPAEVTSVPAPESLPSILTRPVNSDVLTAYATTEGTKAWRNEDEGSWFVKDLYDVIKEYYDKEHILDILVRVNDRMVYRESTEGRAKQMPCFVCTFTKRFMFKHLSQ